MEKDVSNPVNFGTFSFGEPSQEFDTAVEPYRKLISKTEGILLIPKDVSLNDGKNLYFRIKIRSLNDENLLIQVNKSKDQYIKLVNAAFKQKIGGGVEVKALNVSKGSVDFDFFTSGFAFKGYRDLKEMLSDVLDLLIDVTDVITDICNNITTDEPIKDETGKIVMALLAGVAGVAFGVFAGIPMIFSAVLGLGLYQASKRFSW